MKVIFRGKNPKMNEKRENELAEYISRYIYKLDEVPESIKHKYFRYFVTGSTVLIGALAGIPWIETGLKLGEEVQVWLGYTAAGSVVIAYGTTSIWAFLELTDFLKPQPEEILKLINHKSYCLKIYDHFSSHILGILATLPTIYISYKFNSNLFNVALATLISYCFNTVGLYQLKKIISASWKSHFLSSSELEVLQIRNLFNLRITHLQHSNLKTFKDYGEDSYNSALNNPFSLTSVEEDNRHFVNTLHEIETTEPINQNFLLKAFSKIIAIVIPLINALVTGIICYEAILALNLDFSSIGFFFFAALTLLFVVTPLFGIDLYAMGEFSEHFAEGLSNCMNGKIIAHCSKEKAIILFISLVLSSFSALTDAYVAKTSADSSIFKPISVFFACIMWLTKTSLETVAVSTVFDRCLKFAQQKFNPGLSHYSNLSNRLTSLKLLLSQTKSDIILDYQNQYGLKENNCISENTGLNKSSSAWRPQFFKQIEEIKQTQTEDMKNNEYTV